MSEELSQWEEAAATGAVTVEQLDKMVKEYNDKYAEYEAQKAISTQLYKDAEVLEGKLVEAMEQAGKSKYYVEGVGTVYFSDKLVVPTPKTNEDKKKVFTWLREKQGDTVFFATVSINHQTLQKLYNTALEEAVNAGEDASLFHIPGLQTPTSMRSLNFRKEKA